ncbi:MAG: ABC transporter ATP-binding protein [Peptoanaerobacter stomatis]|uniref:ABC transporter ATP-binding protein n=1 Tax=Peptoanaerobacter stomatis TaxID=796937 RepID=UPI003F9F4221
MFKQLKKLKWFLKERARHYIIGILFLQLTNLIVILPPIIIGRAVDSISDGSITGAELFTDISYLTAILTVEYIFGYIWAYEIFLNAIIIDLRLRAMMMKKILTMPRTFFEKFSSGDLMSRATSDIDTISEMLGYGVLAISDGIGYLLAIILAMGFTVSWKLTIVSILPLPILTMLTSYVGEYIHKLYMAQQEAFSKMSDEVLENVNGIRVIRSYVLEKQSVKNFENTTEDVFNKSLKTELVASTFWPATKIFTSISYAIAIGYGVNLILAGEITIGSLISFNVYLGYLIWPMYAIGDFINTAQRGTTSIERIYEVLEEDDDVENKKITRNIDGFDNIKFSDYTFRYPNSKNVNLRGIDLEITRGKTIGIVGRTGSGKSTLIKQLLKEYPVGDGNISIDDLSISEVQKSSLMNEIGYVSQDNILFSKTIRENILMGKKSASEEELFEVIRISDLLRDVDLFANKMDTLVGERGVAISGGQKQRISIARAVIKDPYLLIMDDSLSAVDSRTEAKIIENIRKNRKNKTTIIVTHRLSAVSHADEIIVLDDGVIVERGTHEELILKDGWYNRQYHIQQMEEKEDE